MLLFIKYLLRFILTAIPAFHLTAVAQNKQASTAAPLRVPLGGNTWVHGSSGTVRLLTRQGIANWESEAVSFTTYIRINTPGSMQVKLKAKADGHCRLALTIAGKREVVEISRPDS